MSHPVEGSLLWHATYFDGRSAKRHEVTVERTMTGLVIRGDVVGEVAWNWPELRRDERTAPDEPIRYERGDLLAPEVLVVADPSFLPAMRGVRESGGSISRLRRRTLGSLLLPALAVMAVVAALWIWALPVLAARVASRVPVEWEEALGERAVLSMTATYPVCAEPARVAAMEKMLAALTDGGRGGRYTYRVQIVDAPAVNAFAAPGGYIVVFQGLLGEASSAEEVAGVLAHEIEHVVQQHAVTGILRDMPMHLALSSAIGSSPLGGSVAQVAYQLGSSSYQRSDERAADAGAIRMLGAARISPEGMLDFFRREAGDTSEESGLLNYMSSHPNSAERLEALEAAAGALPPATGPVLTAEEWAALRATCVR